MQNLTTRLSALRRPRLLMNAARHGSANYNRDAHLSRLLGREAAGAHTADILEALLDLEAEHDAQRRAGQATYRIADHVATLSALMSEAQIYSALRLAA